MKAAKLSQRPAFALMKQTDIQSVHHLQMPRWLFSDPRYAEMSLDAKVAYTFLLNRFQLSRKNGWINESGEVFVIFPRKALAKELRICEQRVSAAFHKLAERELIWEKRCGRGDANQIYLARIQSEDDPDYQCAPFMAPENCGTRTADMEGLDLSEPQDRRFKSSENGGSRTAEPAFAEPQILRPSYTDKRKTDTSYMEVSPSVTDRADEEKELADILEACELSSFSPEMARVFENTIERLFYSDSFRVGNATLPRRRVRHRLHDLDTMVLRDAEQRLRANQERQIRNSTQYTMAVLFNCITEGDSDLIVDPYLNSLGP